jgi:hypothetical protein
MRRCGPLGGLVASWNHLGSGPIAHSALADANQRRPPGVPQGQAAALPALRFAELVGQGLFTRKPMHRLDKPPEVTQASPD